MSSAISVMQATAAVTAAILIVLCLLATIRVRTESLASAEDRPPARRQ